MMDALRKALADGAYKAGLDLAQEILEQNPNDRDIRHLAARLCRALGENERAIAHYRAALEADAKDEVALFGLAAFGLTPPPERMPDSILLNVFDRNAGVYELNMSSLGYCVPEILIGRLGEFRPEGKWDVLDVGCGTGLNGPLLKPLAKSLTGIDIAPKMLAHARSKNVYDRLIEAEILGWMDDAREQFDLVIATNVLIYFGGLERLLGGMRRLLKSGGLVAFDLESLGEDADKDFLLEPAGGRYAHKAEYASKLLAALGLNPLVFDKGNMRHEQGKPVDALFVVARAVD